MHPEVPPLAFLRLVHLRVTLLLAVLRRAGCMNDGRVSECLGLQWADVDFVDAQIQVRRTWTCGQVGLPKSRTSKAPVPLHPLLAEFMQAWQQKTPYSQPVDWVFPSTKLKGRQPRVANMLVESYIRPAAAKAGVLCSHADAKGELVEDDSRRFGFRNLRHSLASFPVRTKTDPKTVQALLRIRTCAPRFSSTPTASRKTGWQHREKCSGPS